MPLVLMNSFSVLSAPFNTFNVYVIYIIIYTYTDWWFQTFGLFSISYMGMSEIPTDELIFSEGQVYHQPFDYLTLPWKPWPIEIDGLP